MSKGINIFLDRHFQCYDIIDYINISYECHWGSDGKGI